MNSEFMAASRKRAVGIYRWGPKAPVGANDPVQNVAHRHRVIEPTGAFAVGTRRHRVVAWPGANDCKMGTGQCHKPVPLSPFPFGPGLWHDTVPMLKHWNRVMPRPGTQCPVPGSYTPRVPAAVAVGADASHQYWLQQQLLLLVWIFGLFSSSGVSWINKPRRLRAVNRLWQNPMEKSILDVELMDKPILR